MANPNEAKMDALTKADLITLITELRKPVKTEKEIAEEKAHEQEREAMIETLKMNEANRIAKQKACSHMRSNGSTTAVYVTDLSKLYCQACAAWISPTENPDIFNRLYQLAI